MEPRIQYARTTDGVSIAFATYGAGRPLIWSHPPPVSHVELEWGQPIYRATYSRLCAMGMMVIRFDIRGVGLSDRNVNDISLDARVRDLEAVAGHLNLKSFALVGLEEGGPPAIAYAARNPERVTHLILMNCSARRGGATTTPSGDALIRLVGEDDWEMLTENLAAAVFGYGREETKRYAQFLRACADPRMLRRFTEADHEIDVSDLLGRIRSPTLVVRHTGVKWIAMDASRELATGIPDSRFLLIEGLYADNIDQLFKGVAEFLGTRELAETAVGREHGSGTAVILFADIADSTALTERLGDAAFREKARALDGALRGLIRENGGIPVEGKLLGDGVLAVFTSARKAIEAALACGRAGEEVGLPLHLGLHAGDVIREENNVYGGAVNIAARISALSAPGEVLVSGTVRSLARTSAGVSFEDRGERELKGVGEAVRVWAVVSESGSE